MAEPLSTDRVRMFYTHATGWAVPGAWLPDKPKREARLEANRARLAAEFDLWLAEHDRQEREQGWNDALNAIAWCVDNQPGDYAPDYAHALQYVAEHNAHRATSASNHPNGDGRG